MNMAHVQCTAETHTVQQLVRAGWGPRVLYPEPDAATRLGEAVVQVLAQQQILTEERMQSKKETRARAVAVAQERRDTHEAMVIAEGLEMRATVPARWAADGVVPSTRGSRFVMPVRRKQRWAQK